MRSSTNNKNVIEETDDMFIFPEGSLLPGKDNIITVVQVCLFYPDLCPLVFIAHSRTTWV